MDDQVLKAVSLYLDGGIEFDSLEDRIIPLAFKADPKKGGLVYQLVAEIAYVKDKVSDETTFRSRIADKVTSHKSLSARPILTERPTPTPSKGKIRSRIQTHLPQPTRLS